MSSDDTLVQRSILKTTRPGASVYSMSTRELGQYGERLAAQYLEKKGYEIVDRNITFQRGEIDIWAKKDELLVFVEVKTRRGIYSGSALESVDPKKREQLLKVIACSMMFMAIDMEMQVDVIGIQIVNEGKALLTHVQNIDLFS